MKSPQWFEKRFPGRDVGGDRAVIYPPTRINEGSMYDWWQILTDINRAGVTIARAADITGIPRTTILGYKNSGSEPRHSDGERILQLWRSCCTPSVPMQKGRRECREPVTRVAKQ